MAGHPATTLISAPSIAEPLISSQSLIPSFESCSMRLSALRLPPSKTFQFPIYHRGWESFSPYPSGRCTREDMLRSSPACIHWRSARKVGNHIGTVPSETCGSNNMPSITYSCLAAAHIVSLRGGWQLCVPSVTGSRADTHYLFIFLQRLPPPFIVLRPTAL